MSGLASMGGPPIVVYLLALSHRAAVVRATSIVYFMLASMLSLLLMGLKGLIDREILLWSIASMPVLMAGNSCRQLGISAVRGRIIIGITALVTLSMLAIAADRARARRVGSGRQSLVIRPARIWSA